MNIKKAAYSPPGMQLLALLLFIFSVGLSAHNCPFCSKKLNEANLCPDPDCAFYDDSEDDDDCEGTYELPPPIELPTQQRLVVDLRTSFGACAITTAQQPEPRKSKCKYSNPEAPWLEFVYNNAPTEQGYLDGCREAMRHQYGPRHEVPLTQEHSLESQISHYFNSQNLLLLDLSTWESSEDDDDTIETHYFYLFEINAQGGVYLLTDDEDTFGTQFLSPGRTNNHTHLIRRLEARLKPSDGITLFIYRAKD